MKISFRYCGCCNPQLELSRIEADVRNEVQSIKDGCPSTALEGEEEICILLNGCPVGCADLETLGPGSAAVRRLVVKGWRADGQPDWHWEKGDNQH